MVLISDRGMILPVPIQSRPPLKALKRKQMLYEVVQAEVKNYILEHGLKAGDPLPPETDLAQQLNVSRNSVREAVKGLEALGILESRPGTGLFVRAFTFDPILDNLAYGILFDLEHLTDALEVRCQLELGMVEKVVQKVTPDQVRRLREVLEEMRGEAQKGVYSAEADRAFHQHLYDNVRNILLWKILDIFWQVQRHAIHYGAMPPPADPLESYRVHIPIVDALEAGNAEAMRAAIASHYQGVEKRIRRFQEARSKQST
jgi:DNA-binding FadR family transcriptional regulator